MFKVGDVIEPIENKHYFTSAKNKWIGRIVSIDESGISAETISIDSEEINQGKVFAFLNPEYFKLTKSEQFKSFYDRIYGT